MKRRYTALMLALLMLAQVFAPEVARAKSSEPSKKSTVQLVKMGALDPKTYPKLDNKAILAIQKQARNNQNRSRTGSSGFFSVGSPYLPGQNPSNDEKAAAYGNLRVDFVTEGLNDNGVIKPFQWNEIFGTDSNGNPGTANIYFVQRDAKTNQKINTFKLTVDKAGKYSLNDLYGKPAKLPLYSEALEPYKYEAELEIGISEKVTLLTFKLSETGSEQPSYTTDSEGKLVADIPLYLKIGQTASTKFVSKWNTNVEEANRPKVVGGFNNKTEDDFNYFPFPINDTDVLKIRREQFDLNNDEWPGYMPQLPMQLREVPKVTVDEDMLEDPATYTIDKNTKRITATNGKIYKYDLQYDVINGGKLTMTEMIPVTFDANGGKFASITEEGADQKIVKEVEYGKDLTDMAEKPTKDRETFKGWGIKDGEKIVAAKDADFAKIKEAKTFYAIWGNNDIVAEELTVHESFKDGTGYVNNFIPSLDTLKGQVKIKDAKGDPQALADDDTLQILDDSGNPIADTDLKDKLYEKLKEDDTTEVSRDVTLKAKVTVNGTSQTVDIPIKVIKNIYEAKTEEGKPNYVPKDYVKVTVDPTTKAKDPQKYFYYVNPEAKVVIPGKDPVGTGNNQFTKWLIKGTETEYKLSERHQFKDETTIEAQYVSDVISQEGTTKPDTVPDNFVEVKFVPTDKATDNTVKTFWVNPEKEVTIPVANPVGKQYFTFKEWKMGVNADGAVYNPSTPTKFTDVNGTTITATYDEAKNIIPYDPSATDPMPRPEGYVRVTFAADTGLKLTEQKAYYVMANAGIKLGNAELKKPAYEAETGYKFKEWDKEDSLVIEAADILVTANATKLENVIPEKDGEGNPNTKPEGYKEVIFKIKDGDEAKGSIEGVTKFYVNPTEYVTINPPKTTADTGYEFGAWDKDAKIPTVYKDEVTTITGSFNGLKDIIPKTKEDDSEKPAGYVTVTFELEKLDGKEVGEFASDATTVYYVNPNEKVYLLSPTPITKTGYKFKGWTPQVVLKRYSDDTIIKGRFEKLADIIPGGPEIPIPKGYVTVTFLKGNHGELSGQTVYYVNPEANKKMADITKPTVTPETGYTFDKWSIGDNTLIKNNQRPIAGYNTLDDVIPKTKDDDSEKPEDYITVTFVKGEHGQKLTGQAVYYVNPNKAVVLKDKAPTAVPNTGYDFAGWDTTIEKAIQYKDGDKITALYNEKGDVIPQEKPDGSDKPAGYLTVTFNKGDHGELSGKTVYYVKPNKEVTVPAPTVTPATGYEFKDWDKELTKTFTEDTKITAQYKDRGNIIPQEKTDGSDRPDGYFTVTFKADANGSLSGTTVYYVKPNTDIDLTNTAKAITKNPNVGYTAEGGTWSPEITSKQYTDNAEYTFNFNALGDVIPETNNDGTKNDKPDGYVTVKLIPTNKATAETKAEKIYFVNPTKNVTITNKPEGKKEKVGEIEYTYNFKGWTVTSGTIASWDNETIAGKFIQDTDITAQYKTNIDAGTILPAPVPKKNVVTPKGDTPEAKDLIKNIPGSETDPLPEGTKITYTDDGTPDVKNPGDTTAKVKIEYPGGKTVIVKVPITVVENVVPQKGNEKPKVPDNYVMVTFEIDGKGGKIADGETTIYYVNPKQEVTIPQPNTVANTGYKFDKWDPDTKMAQTYDKNTTVKGSFKGQKDIIPSTNEEGTPNEKPNGYVTITFEKGANGSLEGQAVYYVNPNAGKTLADVTHPTIKPDTGFTANGWDKEDTTAISGTEDITVTAQYAPIDDVIPKDNPQGGENEKPDGYITVKFSTEKDGKIKGTDKTEKIVYVNPNKSVKLEGYAPEVTPNTGFTFADWDASIQREIKYQNNDVIKAKYNAIGDVIPQEKTDGSDKPEGYLTVTFDKGEHGTLSGKTVYYVKPNKEVTVPAPTVTPTTGYVFKKWDQALTQTFTKDTTITAQYGNKPADPRPTTDYVVTELGVQPKPQDYEKAITPPAGKRIKDVQIVDRPNVDKPGKTSATVKVIYEDGTTDQISVPVFVQKKDTPTPDLRPYPVPGDCNNTCDQPNKPNQPNQPNVGKDALNTTDHYQYLIGYPDGNFGPNKGMTRAEAATMFTRLLNERPVKWRHYNAGLSDIRPGDWYANTVGYAVQRGIVSGYPDGSFKPNKPITRAEFAAIASRFDALAQGNAISFSDLAPSHWGYDAIRSAATKGWISGYPDNTFRPEQAITRAEVTAITNRMLNRHADLYWIDAHPSEVIRFGDVKRSDWYFEPIMEATMGHDFIRDRDKKTEHWTGVNGKSFI